MSDEIKDADVSDKFEDVDVSDEAKRFGLADLIEFIRKVDLDIDGFISAAEFIKHFAGGETPPGIKLNENQAQEAIAAMDKDEDGCFSFKEVIEWMEISNYIPELDGLGGGFGKRRGRKTGSSGSLLGRGYPNQSRQSASPSSSGNRSMDNSSHIARKGTDSSIGSVSSSSSSRGRPSPQSQQPQARYQNKAEQPQDSANKAHQHQSQSKRTQGSNWINDKQRDKHVDKHGHEVKGGKYLDAAEYTLKTIRESNQSEAWKPKPDGSLTGPAIKGKQWTAKLIPPNKNTKVGQHRWEYTIPPYDKNGTGKTMIVEHAVDGKWDEDGKIISYHMSKKD